MLLISCTNALDVGGYSFPNISASRNVLDPSDALSSILWTTDGEIFAEVGVDGSWYTPITAGVGNTHYLKLVYTGSNVGLTSGSWYQLNVDRTASLSQTVVGSQSASGDWYISTTNSDAGIVGSGTFSISASVTL